MEIAQSEWSCLINGNFLVALFCVISGIVISLQVFKLSEKEKITNVIIKRYLRLVFPVFGTCLLVWVLMNNSAFTNLKVAEYTKSPWAIKYYKEKLSFKDVFVASFMKIWFLKDDSFSTAFWMLPQLFLGSYISILLSMLGWNCKRNILPVYLFIGILFLGRDDFLVAFVLGTGIAYMYTSSYFKIRGWIAVLLCAIGAFLGGFPSGIHPTNTYANFLFSVNNITCYQFWHIIGATLLILGLFCLQKIQRVLESKGFLFFGKISYAVYLLHIPILFSMSTSLFLYFNARGMEYKKNCIIVYVVTLGVLLFLSWLYNRYIEKGFDIVINKILFYFFNEKEHNN